MRIWRVSNFPDLSGRGGVVSSGRWNRLGTPIIYCSDHPATAMLEVLASLDRRDVPSTFTLLTIDTPDEAPALKLSPEELGEGWQAAQEMTRKLGSELLDRAEHLIVLVPSVLVPGAWNVLLNPRHRDARRCKVVDIMDYAWDPRLIG